jgi:ribosomal-protein-alanine N-acetyltransferase
MATNPDFKGDGSPGFIIDERGAGPNAGHHQTRHYRHWYDRPMIEHSRSMIPAGETQRLLLRPLQLADAAQIQEKFPRWEVVRYLLNRVPWPYPPDGALQFIRDMALPAMERGQAWHWTLRLKTAPKKIIGLISLVPTEENNRGFWLDPSHQGRGLMSEACEWANDFWFNMLGIPVLRVSKAAANIASRRISEKQGMRKVGESENDYVSGRLLSENWEITAEEWRAWTERNR